MVVVVWLLVRLPAADVLLIVAGAMTAASGAAYVTRALRLMNKTTLQMKDSSA
jgi:hypothetical protein